MIYENIEGFFNFDNIYQRMVNEAKDGAVFAEIGTFKGKSAVFMAEAIKRSGKDIKWYVIDTFEGTEGEPVKEFITETYVGDSKILHNRFPRESIDFLFIDGDHSYKGIKAYLDNWFHKVKRGGLIGGHDFTEPTCGVRIAVEQYFLFTGIVVDRTSWLYRKR